MKFDLKKFPVTAIIHYAKRGDIDEIEKEVFAILEWREGFEKELRQRLKWRIPLHPKYHMAGEIEIIKEILGED